MPGYPTRFAAPPKPLTTQEREIKQLQDQIKVLKKCTAEVEEKLAETLVQARGGDVHPADDEDHPGNILLKLGWKYHPNPEDHMHCEWEAPGPRRGEFELMPISMALGIACRQLAERLVGPTAWDRLSESDDPVYDPGGSANRSLE